MIIKRKITVDSDRLGLVQLKLDKLNKKAIKLGIEPSHIVSQVDRVIKEKQQINKMIISEGNYGLSYINIMTQDITGNNVVWFGSNKVLNDGEKVTLKGSIKALNDRDGKKQTILTRCKIV